MDGMVTSNYFIRKLCQILKTGYIWDWGEYHVNVDRETLEK